MTFSLLLALLFSLSIGFSLCERKVLRSDFVISSPTKITVILIGFNGTKIFIFISILFIDKKNQFFFSLSLSGDGAHSFKLDDAAFGRTLSAALPSGRIQVPGHGPLSTSLDFSFNVFSAPRGDVLGLERVLESKLNHLDKVPGAQPATYDIPAEWLSSEWDRLYNVHAGGSSPNVVILMNPAKARIKASPDQKDMSEDAFLYRYVNKAGARSQTWVSSKRYVVVDLSAGPVVMGPAGAAEGTVSAGTFPRLGGAAAGGAAGATGREGEVRAHLAGLVISAVRHVFAPDAMYPHTPPSKKILVPVIVLHNHNHFNPLYPNKQYSIDLKAIKEEVSKLLLPGQELTVVSGSHSIHDHRPVSMAVSKALRTDSVPEVSSAGQYVAQLKPYLDSSILYRELKDSADVLAAGIMGASSVITKRTFFNSEVPSRPTVSEDFDVDDAKDLTIAQQAQADGRPSAGKGALPLDPKAQFVRSHGVRVIPVYVLSLAGYDEDLLLDRQGLLSVHQDCVIVLQTPTPSVKVPFRSEGQFLSAHPQQPTRHIVSGISTALAGLLPPYQRWSSPKGRLVDDYTWAVGHHPFGPFSNFTAVSQIMADVALRNALLTRLHSALLVVKDSMDRVDALAKRYFVTALGNTNLPRTDSWIDLLYARGRAGDGAAGAAGAGSAGAQAAALAAASAASVLGRPFIANATIERLHSELDKLDLLFTQVADAFTAQELIKAYAHTAPLLLTADAFQKYVDAELKVAEKNMECFSVVHTNSEQEGFTSFALKAFASMAVTGLLVQKFLKARS
jgi:hypothetical protein